MEEERDGLEKLGYSFEVAEESITEAGVAGVFYRVTIRHHDLLLATRSEIERERALARAYRFARRHSEGEDPRKITG
jgi:hypothetical protein